MQLPRSAALSLLLLAATVTGCASQRTIIAVPLPLASSNSQHGGDGPLVFINTVIDKRVFATAPAANNVPTLEAAEATGRAIEKRAIGRKRTIHGQLQGDVVLAEGQSVARLIDAALRQALLADGYRLATRADELGSEGYQLDVIINNYWSWLTPDLWSATLSCEIATEVKFSQQQPAADAKQHSQNVKIRTNNTVATLSHNAWLALTQQCLRDYSSAAAAQLQAGQP